MTAPVIGGYPDWVRQQSNSQVLEVNDVAVVKNGAFFYPNRYVGNAQWLTVWANTLTFAVQIEIRFWADAGGTILIERYTISIGTGGVARQPVPILGPFMDVVIDPSGAGNYTYSLQIVRSGVKGVFAGSNIEQAVFSQNNTAIAGSTNTTLTSLVVKEGWATWTSNMTGGSWAVVVFTTDYLGTNTLLDFMDNTVTPFNRRRVYLPPSTISVQVSNFAVGAQTYRLFMTREYNAA